MTTAHAPLTLARVGCEVAVRRLPDIDDRIRYRAEFAADLHALGPVGQLRYVTGVVSQMFALRAALADNPTKIEEAAMSVTTKKPFIVRCSIFRAHYWVVRSTEDGGLYRACRRCDRMAPPVDRYGPSGFGGVF